MSGIFIRTKTEHLKVRVLLEDSNHRPVSLQPAEKQAPLVRIIFFGGEIVGKFRGTDEQSTLACPPRIKHVLQWALCANCLFWIPNLAGEAAVTGAVSQRNSSTNGQSINRITL
jgi:hypothetical protein